MRRGCEPTWLRGGRGIDPPRERQVLVEGVTVAGVALATVLRRAGYDPVVVGADRPATTGLSVVWPSTFDRLDALGATAAVREAGASTARTAVWWTDGDGWVERSLPTTDGDAPVVCRTAALREALAADVPGTAVAADRRIGTVEPGPDAVTVGFADGVAEQFDLVVRTVGPTGRGVRLCGATVETVGPTGVVDAWRHGAVAQVLPRPDGAGGRLRIATADGDPGAHLQSGEWPSPMSVDDVPTDGVAVEQIRGPEDGAWGAGRVARCGSGAAPVAPATGLRATLGLADALTLGVELARDVPVEEAVDAYASRRRRGVGALFDRREAALDRCRYPTPGGPTPLPTVAGLRAVGLAEP